MDLKWIVMRNFEDMPNKINIDNHKDVDLLVNDYYLVKRILDADSATKSRFDDGKNRILNYVIISNKKVLFDFRYIGDNYYDKKFQINMMDNRVKHKNFYIPNKTNYLFSLIYHAIIHKKQISTTYKNIFLKFNILKKNINKPFLKNKLDEFMNKMKYQYVRPEPSVKFYIN